MPYVNRTLTITSNMESPIASYHPYTTQCIGNSMSV